MSFLFRLACAPGLALAVTVSNLHAATVCSSIVAKRQIPAAALAQAARPLAETQACTKNCRIAGLQGSEALLPVLPGPRHLPVVSAPDDVASWHAEIFERLAQADPVAAEGLRDVRVEQGDLDRAIEALEENPLSDELQLKRLKKRKLMLKDQIFMLQRQSVPDIPA